MVKHIPFYNRILFKFLVPVLIIGSLCSTILVSNLSEPLKNFLVQNFDANLKFASLISLQNCEDSFSYLLDLRMERNAEMNKVMQKEVVDKINDIHKRFPHIDFVILGTDNKIIKSTLDNSIKQNTITIPVNKDEKPAFAKIGKRKIRGLTKVFPFWNWKIITFAFEDNYQKPVNMAYRITYLSASLVFATVIITLLAAFYLLISKPLKKLVDATKEISEGEFTEIDKISESEFGDLMSSFNMMVGNLRKEKNEVKNLINQLSESEALFRSQFEYGNIGIAITTHDGKWVRANGRLCRLLGYTEDELRETDWPEIFDKEHLIVSRESFIDLLKGKTDSFSLDMKMYHRSGNILYSHVSISCVREEDGKVRYLIASILDITERKAAEQARIESNRILRTVLDTIPVRVYWKDFNGFYIGANQSFAEDAGLKNPEALAGKTDYEISPGRNAELSREDDLIVMETGEAKILHEYPMLNKDGTTNWYLASKVPMKDEKNITIGVLGTYQDITEKKEIENKLAQLRNYLSNIIDSMPSILIGVDKKGVVTLWNKEAYKETNITEDKAEGKPLEKVFPRLSARLDEIKESIEKRKVKSNPRRSRILDDETHYEDITIYPLISNGVDGAVIRVDNTTEKVLMEEMMVQTEKMLSVGGLAAGMAHEINNPLAGMIQTANVLESRLSNLEIPANIKAAEESGIDLVKLKLYSEKRGILRMVKAINESGKQVAEIINNMLSFARKSNSSISSYNPSELMDQILKIASTDYDLKKRFDFKTIKIVKEYDDKLPLVQCEGAKIQQVLLNILRNGAQAMQEKPGTRENRFILRLMKDEEMLKIEIEDNGPGMEENVRKRVFEPFFTTKAPGIGTGLGLSVSYFIITENHRGTMEVKTKKDEGTTFTIKIPFKRAL